MLKQQQPPKGGNGGGILVDKATALQAMADRFLALVKETTITEADIEETIRHWDCQAVGQRIYVARINHEKIAASGIVLPQEQQDRQFDGVVISAGPLAWVNDAAPEMPEGGYCAQPYELSPCRWYTPEQMDSATRRWLRPGDRITFSTWSGATVDRSATVVAGIRKLMVMNADDVVGIPKGGA